MYTGCKLRGRQVATSKHHHNVQQTQLLRRRVTSVLRSDLQPLAMSEHASDAEVRALAEEPEQQSRVKVRPLQQGDKERWLVLFKDYIRWYKAEVADDVVEQTWQNIMAGGEGNHKAFVAEDSSSSQVVGLAHFLLHKSTWSKTHYCYLEDLYVDPQVRAQGVGQALIAAVYQAADDLGVTKTYWLTQERNYRARGLYDKMGKKSEFIHYERRKSIQ